MINIPKGTKDVLPAQSYKWRYIEDTARDVAMLYNFKEARTPVFEHTELFRRGVGETTDVVNKEMYTFEDKGGRSVTLKPEGTAGIARMFIENGLSNSPLPMKAYYIIPAFRYERPQAGRLREFHQFGLEVYGSSSPETDAEVIFAASSFLKRLGLKGVKLELNSIGCRICRTEYNKALKKYFEPHIESMCAVCRSRFDKNPLRMLDCKDENCKKITSGAPKITDFLCPDCRGHFDKVQTLLADLGIEYSVNSRIVRGLDYYTRTVFEFVSSDIGAQGTICGGGRYDDLLGQLGSASVPAVGFAVGIERLLLLMENTGTPFPEDSKPKIYLGGMDEESRVLCFKTAAHLRDKGISAETDLMQRSVKAQMKYADKLGAQFVAVVGESETSSGILSVKRMVDGYTQEVKIENLYSYLSKEE